MSWHEAWTSGLVLVVTCAVVVAIEAAAWMWRQG